METDARALKKVGLVYTTDAMPGIRRVRSGRGFRFLDPDGKAVDASTLRRIRSLAIPPAYERVWICPLPNGHLQATGFDARGRKQYRYHPKFRETRDEAKYGRMLAFGEALPAIRQRVNEDLKRPGLSRERVLGAIVHLLERSLIRVGSEEYARENNHYGLTTMRNRHLKVEGETMRFRFVGKSGIKHEVEIHDRRLARIIKQVQELPGQELFHYVDDEGEVRNITSSDVNTYLKEISEGEFTAKDFRTWAGTVLAFTQLAALPPVETKKALKANVTQVFQAVAKQLGNTPAVCRKCYVHPVVVEHFTTGDLRKFLEQRGIREDPEAAADLVECAEDVVLELLREHEKKQNPRRRAA